MTVDPSNPTSTQKPIEIKKRRGCSRPPGMTPAIRRIWLATTSMIYVALAAIQLGLPGLHYDEAREAGINAMELVIGAPVSAFPRRDGERTRTAVAVDGTGLHRQSQCLFCSTDFGPAPGSAYPTSAPLQ